MTAMFYLALAGALAGIGYAVAACIREWFRGRALLIRAQRGDPEPPTLIQIPMGDRVER